jgi:hypothetical protein
MLSLQRTAQTQPASHALCRYFAHGSASGDGDTNEPHPELCLEARAQLPQDACLEKAPQLEPAEAFHNEGRSVVDPSPFEAEIEHVIEHKAARAAAAALAAAAISSVVESHAAAERAAVLEQALLQQAEREVAAEAADMRVAVMLADQARRGMAAARIAQAWRAWHGSPAHTRRRCAADTIAAAFRGMQARRLLCSLRRQAERAGQVSIHAWHSQAAVRGLCPNAPHRCWHTAAHAWMLAHSCTRCRCRTA